jgi:hypothetical protein
MSNYFVLAAMIFLHIIDDYCLQAPCLCDLKQKSFWEKNTPSRLYRYDYIWALLMHGFSWSFMIMLPIALSRGFNVDINFFLLLICNAGFHAAIDDIKANKFIINLWTDQLYHMAQIATTFIVCISGGI